MFIDVKKLFKHFLLKFENWWKYRTNDFIIELKDIKLVSGWVLIVDFISDGEAYYLTIDGDYKELRKKYLQKNNNIEPISFKEYSQEIGLLIPIEDVIKLYKKQWIKKC